MCGRLNFRLVDSALKIQYSAQIMHTAMLVECFMLKFYTPR